MLRAETFGVCLNVSGYFFSGNLFPLGFVSLGLFGKDGGNEFGELIVWPCSDGLCKSARNHANRFTYVDELLGGVFSEHQTKSRNDCGNVRSEIGDRRSVEECLQDARDRYKNSENSGD